MSDQSGGSEHYAPGSVKAPRPTTLVEVKDNKLTKRKVDGEAKDVAQPK